MLMSVVLFTLLGSLSHVSCNVTTVSGAEDPSSDDEIPLNQPERADILVRLHGSLMMFAWGTLAPAGIMLALFYKRVCPKGQWFYAHIVLMIGTLVFSLLGVVPIVVHANGRWLSTTTNNFPHQILGIVALGAVGINPFLAICRCHQTSSWRWIYNLIHGFIGLIVGEGAALGAMLLGLHIIRELVGVDMDYVHYAIYSMSSTIAAIIMLAALFNIYSINYQKSHPTKEEDLGVTSQVPSEFPEPRIMIQSSDSEDDEDIPENVRCRCCTGLFILLVLLGATGANITMLIFL